MKASSPRRPSRNEGRETNSRRNDARQRRHYEAFRVSDQPTESMILEVHNRMVKIMPRLRRFVCSLSGGGDFSEDLIQDTYVRALSHLDQWQPGTRLDSWMFRIARNLWIDQMRTERVHGEAVDIDVIGHLLSCDGRVIAENRIVLQELRKDIAQLSMDQRNVIRLVCGYGLSYKEAGKILNLPPGTVMSRLARARNALQKYM
jgi:RNA polymerase sigma-70 factor, ECF subfamily